MSDAVVVNVLFEHSSGLYGTKKERMETVARMVSVKMKWNSFLLV